MRLPSVDEVDNADERSLWEHDVVELHSDLPTAQATTYRRRLEVILKLVERWSPSGAVVDAACAQGNVAISLGERGRFAIGMDLRSGFLSYAHKKDDKMAAQWVIGSLEALPFRSKSVGCIVLGEVLEHVAHPESVLEQARKALGPGGIIIASTPNGDRLFTGLPNLSDIAHRADLESQQFQPDANGHLFLLTKSELILSGTTAGLEFIHHSYIQTPPVTGWPRLQAVVGRIPLPTRLILNRGLEVTPLARLVSAGQVAVFRAH